MEFLPLLEEILERLPRNVWLPYARTLLMSQLGKTQRVQMELVHLLKTQNNQFWAWASLAESLAMEGRDNDSLSCYCKAFLLPAQGELATHVREAFSFLLVKMRLYAEARTEIEQVLKARKKKTGKAAKIMDSWLEEEWYKTARSAPANKMLYVRHAGRADAFLWA